MITVLQAGPFATVQDLGRQDFIAEGIGPSGAVDRLALMRANKLAGNPDGAAGIEFTGAPLRFRVECDGLVAVTGADGPATRSGIAFPTHWAEPTYKGDVIEIAPSSTGMWRYVAISGGIDVPVVLASRSTDVKNGFGGLDGGRALRAGDVLKPLSGEVTNRAWCRSVRHWRGVGLSGPAESFTPERSIRVMVAREYQAFTPASRAAVWLENWQVGSESNRQGYRLNGTPLETETSLSLLSYGLIPGTIQVPQAGQPIVQLAEANTCGGYPRLGVVIEADLGRLAQVRPGQTLRFERVTRAEALDAMQVEMTQLEHIQNLPRALAC